jgi:uncharacterized repeat protein (TIGR01451 family)/CSLREA domain-containing protein
MSRPSMPRAYLHVPLLLTALAGCQDPAAPPAGMQPRVAQGDLATWTVNSLEDPGDGVCDDAECTLREAIATASSGGTIVFAGGLEGAIGLTDGDLIIRKDLTINGDGRITVDAQGNSRVMEVHVLSVATPITVMLDGLTLQNGHEAGAGGLAIFSDASVAIRNSTIANNTSTADAGGIWIGSNSSLTLINSSADSNTAVGLGGGIYNEGTLTVTASTISGNKANSGGGLHNDASATATVLRSTISGNAAPAFAAGIANFGSLIVRSSTVTRNSGSAANYGGIWSDPAPGAQVANSIIAGNVANADDNCGGNVVSGGYNLSDSSGCDFSAAGDVAVPRDRLFVEVFEQELKDNGGPTKTHALIARGRAADAGYCPGETTDQRGFARPVDDPAMPNALDACDIGAYELQGPVAVVADLMISQTVNKTSVKQGELLTYSIRVQNLGPETAPGVVVTDVLPTGATFVEARHAKGTHTAPPRGETGTVTWSVGDMVDQANEVAEIIVTVLVKGKTTITNTASVTGDVRDPNEANNSAAIRVSVASGTGGKGGGSK